MSTGATGVSSDGVHPIFVPQTIRVFSPLTWKHYELPSHDPFADLAPWSYDLTLGTCSADGLVRRALEHLTVDPRAQQLIAFDVFSGYSECHVLAALLREGRLPCLERVFFCDPIFAHLDEACQEFHGTLRTTPCDRELDAFAKVWRRVCSVHNVKLSVCKSAWELVRNLDDVPTEVFMINTSNSTGPLRFKRLAPSVDDEREEDAITELWTWCGTHVSHPPEKILYGAVLKCDDWTWKKWAERRK